MRNRLGLLVFAMLFFGYAMAQVPSRELPRPKLAVGMMVDQMRWDFLYRYYDRYSENGFKRLLREGFACENTYIPYAQTVTAAGHASVYTGSVPAVNGIMGNDWFDRQLGRKVYCVEDNRVKTVGGSSASPPMSPRNLWTTTVTDELRLATNFRGKVIGVALKDRGSILPAGHSANAAYWYDGLSGNWVSSTYYMDQLPSWAMAFNRRKMVDSLYALGWNTLYPVNTYTQSDADEVAYERKFGNAAGTSFPYNFSTLVAKNYAQIVYTPQGSTLTLEFAKTALISEELGKDAITDFLAISLSSPDYTGHQFGPNSVEIEDTYLRLDQELAKFFDFLDKQVGKGQYVFFMTADHGVAHVPGYLQKHHIPSAVLGYPNGALDQLLHQKFGMRNLIQAAYNNQVYLNQRMIDSAAISMTNVKRYLVQQLNLDSNILLAFDNDAIADINMPAEVRERFMKGYNAKLAGDIQVMLKPAHFFNEKDVTTHGAWYPNDAHIPLVFMGWGVRPGRLYRQTYMTDISATIAALLHIQEPNGSIGKVITELIK